jgi:hypothetical protein
MNLDPHLECQSRSTRYKKQLNKRYGNAGCLGNMLPLDSIIKRKENPIIENSVAVHENYVKKEPVISTKFHNFDVWPKILKGL